MACRLPGGVDTPEGLWDVVAEGRDVISEFPADRGWDLEGLFDPDPRTPAVAQVLYPLRRVRRRRRGFRPCLLWGWSVRSAGNGSSTTHVARLSWEALERAGIDPTALRGTATGVFAGVMAQAYGALAEETEGYRIGIASSVATGRVA